jgi:hypothetical protein
MSSINFEEIGRRGKSALTIYLVYWGYNPDDFFTKRGN